MGGGVYWLQVSKLRPLWFEILTYTFHHITAEILAFKRTSCRLKGSWKSNVIFSVTDCIIMESNGMSANSFFLKQIFLEVSHLNRWCEIHVTYIIKQFGLFVANSSDIPIQYLYSSSSFSINTQNHSCSDHNINHSVCGVPSVLWALLSVQQGQRYCRQTIGHYSNSSNRHTALYIYSVPSVLWALLSVQQGQRYCRQTIGHYSNSSNRHTALYIYSVPSVLWPLLSVQQGQKYCRQTIGHYTNSSNRHTALYIYSVPSELWALLSVQQGQRYCRQTVGHYSNSTNRHTALYIYRGAHRRDTGFVQIMYRVIYSFTIKTNSFSVFMLYLW